MALLKLKRVSIKARIVEDPRITVLQSMFIPEEEVLRRSRASYPETSPIIKAPIPIMMVETKPPTIALLIIGLIDWSFKREEYFDENRTFLFYKALRLC